MERSLVLGVDAGSTRAVAALAELAEGEPQIVGVGMVPCRGLHKGLVVDLNATADAVRQAVAQAVEMAGRPGPPRAVVAVSGPYVRSVVSTAEVPVYRPSGGVTPEDIRRALDAASSAEIPAEHELLHVVPRAYRLDGADGVMNPLGLAGRSIAAEAHLITGEKLPLQNLFRSVALAGLEVSDYEVGVRAAGQSVLTEAEKTDGVLLLEIGAATTGVAVYDRGHLWHVSVLPVGGDHITSDIASLLRVPVGVAESLKLERGWAAADLAPDAVFEVATPSGLNRREVNDKQLAAIIESRVQEILQLAAAQVKRSGYAGLFPGGLVITGGGARLNGLVQMAGDCLCLPARVGSPEGALVNGPEFAVAAGLVRWGARQVMEEAAAAAAPPEQLDGWGRVRRWFAGFFR